MEKQNASQDIFHLLPTRGSEAQFWYCILENLYYLLLKQFKSARSRALWAHCKANANDFGE